MLAVGASAGSCSGRARLQDHERPIELLVSSEPETLDPRYAVDAVAIRTTRLLHAGLTRLDPATLEPIPYVARAWQWHDERTLFVELRDDVRFHSGALAAFLGRERVRE
jgi:ABC-type oligopeptide transport system substrate-binding subunit